VRACETLSGLACTIFEYCSPFLLSYYSTSMSPLAPARCAPVLCAYALSDFSKLDDSAVSSFVSLIRALSTASMGPGLLERVCTLIWMAGSSGCGTRYPAKWTSLSSSSCLRARRGR